MFHVGQEVVCINAKRLDDKPFVPPLVKGDLYTIEDIAGDLVDVGLKTAIGHPWYVDINRFAPIDAMDRELAELLDLEEDYVEYGFRHL